MSSSDDGSTSYEESDSSDVASDKVWTCDDIYPAKANKTSDSDDDSSSSEQSFEKTQKPKGKEVTQTYSSSSDSDESDSESESSDDSSDSVEERPGRAAPVTRKVQRHSSGEIEVHLTAQSKALTNAKLAEIERRKVIETNNDAAKKRDAQTEEAENISRQFENLSKEYDSSDESMESLKKLVAQEHAKKNSAEGGLKSEEKAKFEKRNMEREMRLAKARERIEKKKDNEAAKEAKERLKDKETTSKLDMSKAARVERAYSWYSRMAMPTREKMKERVEYMPASSGVTADDVDLLPWNARGTFVSVAAMMRMNRTAFSVGKKTASSIESETDSD